MTMTLLDLKLPLDRPFVELLGDLDSVLRTQETPYLLSGAMAREILLHYGYGCAPGRKTNDIDFGVTVRDWETYLTLKDSLAASGRFREVPKQAQRMIHIGTGTIVDLVPFGGVADSDGSIAYPPDHDHVMRVLGYEEAYRCALHLQVNESLIVPMASAVGQVILKLVAWEDRAARTEGRDAVDLRELFRNYAVTLSDAELYDLYPEAMELHGFQQDPAAAWILGKRVSDQVDDRLRGVLAHILRPESRVNLLNHMMRGLSFDHESRHGFETEALLDAFERGLGLR